MIVISPWSKGGWVNSELFDHTSLIQFIEQRFGGGERVREPNITPWRRAVTGDLTSAFDFRSPDDRRVPLPNTDGFVPPDTDRHPDFKPAVPAQQVMPRQEPGVRPARAVPYELQATATVDLADRKVAIRFANTGRAAAVFQVRSGSNAAGPWTYTVEAHHDLADTWDFGAAHEIRYDLSVYGPNGFFRAFQGSLTDRGRANLAVQTIYEPAHNTLVLEIHNAGARLEGLHIDDAYAREHTVHSLAPGERLTRRFALERSFGWYDVALRVDSDPAFRRQVAGHLETGQDSMSDPLLGR
jgi:phospholipase C